MKRVAIVLVLTLCAVSSLFAVSAEDVSSESIATMLSEAGYNAWIDEEGDVTVTDQYGMEYWIMAYPEENRLWIQSGWTASDEITSKDAYSLVNESNRNLFFARCWYEPMSRTFYADYDLLYPSSGLDADFLASFLEEFFLAADIFTDYLIGEGAL